MEPRLINVNDLGRYTVEIDGHRYVPWVRLAEAPTAQRAPAKLDRSRWEGCPDCMREWGVCAIPTNRFEIRQKGFCGSCGRPLTEEAWAELERRINGGSTNGKNRK